MSRNSPLILIGPAATGKSTLGQIVATSLSVPFVDIDEVADHYYEEVGWSLEQLSYRSSLVGRVAAEREWEVARAHAVTRVLADYPGAVVAMGAGNTSYKNERHFQGVRNALKDMTCVLLVLPSADRSEALSTLRSRALDSKGTDWISSGHDFLAEWLDDEGTRDLATETIITGSEAPEVTAERIVAMLHRASS
ncbi:shikimate kinase [Glutamicibacter sp.]|jgi:Shikimate kinase|uniref:shikimate kinase n=1 Tax=Glutamicibacter sp. TaxID=1931995 RepID=UPI002B464C06|nr:shikimate kinase [Glutamicibacter sp.]HJX77894.1 shikimate kinase [Glutamicibacter sp.]